MEPDPATAGTHRQHTLMGLRLETTSHGLRSADEAMAGTGTAWLWDWGLPATAGPREMQKDLWPTHMELVRSTSVTHAVTRWWMGARAGVCMNEFQLDRSRMLGWWNHWAS